MIMPPGWPRARPPRCASPCDRDSWNAYRARLVRYRDWTNQGLIRLAGVLFKRALDGAVDLAEPGLVGNPQQHPLFAAPDRPDLAAFPARTTRRRLGLAVPNISELAQQEDL